MAYVCGRWGAAAAPTRPVGLRTGWTASRRTPARPKPLLLDMDPSLIGLTLSGPEPLAAGSTSAALISCRSLATLHRVPEGGQRVNAGSP